MKPENLLRVFWILAITIFGAISCTSSAETKTSATTPVPISKEVITSTPSTIATTTPFYRIEQRCVQVVQTEAPGLDTPLLLHFSVQGDEAPYTYSLNLKTGVQTRLGNWGDETVSPDGIKVAYWDFDLTSVVVADAKGNKLRVLSDPDETLSPVSWLDNQRLMLDRRRRDFGDVFVPPSLIVLDIHTGEQVEWLPDYPNFSNQYNDVYWLPRSRLILNRRYNDLVYPAWEDDLPVILWDLDSNREIARIHNGNRVSAPQWSPDGTQFVISAPSRIDGNGVTYKNIDDGLPRKGGNDLFLVNHNGKIKRLTYFTTTDDSRQESYSWSPDGQRIAFLLQSGGFAGIADGDFSIVELKTGDVTNYCINGSYLWSMDGQYIVVSSMDEKLQYHVYLVDLKSAQTWHIADDAYAVGWMVSSQ